MISNVPDAMGIQRAEKAGIDVSIMQWNKSEMSRSDYDLSLAEVILGSSQHPPSLVVLAG